MRLPNVPFTVLDTETTGFVPRVHRVMEFASMRAEGGKIVASFEELFSVPDEVPPHVQAITRIRPADLQGKPALAERKDAVLAAVGEGTLIVGQNIGFDIGMLKGEGLDLSGRPTVDTSMLASLVFPELPSYSLGYVSQVLRLNHEPVHRALGDVRATLELFAACWERICALPKARIEELRDVWSRSEEGYRLLAAALPKTGGKGKLAMPDERGCTECTEHAALARPAVGTVALQEEDLHPAFLHRVLRAAAADTGARHIVAVKNIEALLRRCRLPEGVSVLYPPFLLPNPAAIDALGRQEALTADEATLLIKLRWFVPATRADIALHGNEKELWAGRIACTDDCAAYRAQFASLTATVVMDQRQLLECLQADTEETRGLLEGSHVIIDDGSMLEETATKALGSVCPLQELRSAAEHDAQLEKCADALALWVEKTRGGQDMRFLAPSDLAHPDCVALRDRIAALLKDASSPQVRRLLGAAVAITDPARLSGNVTWIEVWQNGSVVLQAYPQRIDPLLQSLLFGRHATTVLVPNGTASLPLVVPAATPVVTATVRNAGTCVMTVSPGTKAEATFQNPPPGKTIVLLSSRKAIEQAYVKHVEALEQRGVTLLCQGLSGSTGRMEAEFAAAEGTALCVLTPWSYEGFELPAGTVDRLVLEQLPFDSPSQPLIQARGKFLQDAFNGYLLPKLEHRLFRLLRTLKRHARGTPEVAVLDERLGSKAYGPRVTAYLEAFGTAAAAPATKKGQPSLF